jgi:PGF-CTERM protein
MQAIESPERRRVLAGLCAGLVATGVETGRAGAESHEAVTVTLENEGSIAWTIVSADETVGPTDSSNPTLTLTPGTRYQFENGGWNFHPLAFRDAEDTPLLSQDEQGSFEDDDAVDWVDNGETLAFTLTDDLAAELDDYVCTVHPTMEGAVETDETDSTDDTGGDTNDTGDSTDDTSSGDTGGGYYGGGTNNGDDGTDNGSTDDGGDDTGDGNSTDGTDDDGDSADGGGPGFGPLAALAGLGGVAAYAARRFDVGTGNDT